MRRRFLKGLAVTLLAAGRVVAGSGAGHADSKRKRKRKGRDKHDDVLIYRQKKNILSFSRIRAIVRRRTKGRIIGTEFEVKNGIPVYEFKYISTSGQIREIYLDARTGRVIADKAG